MLKRRFSVIVIHLPMKMGGAMLSYLSRIKTTVFVPTALLLLCAAIFAINFWSSSADRKWQRNIDVSPIIKNRTESFQVVGIKKSQDNIALEIKNDSRKIINAYVLSLDDGVTRLGTDYIASDGGINPGTTVTIDIPFSQFLPAQTTEPQRNTITVLTVVFEDSSSEGDVLAANYIKETRRGEKIQMRNIRKLIRMALKPEGKDDSLTLPELRQKISSLPETVEDQSSMNFGMHYAKERVIKQIASVEKEEVESQLMKVSASNNLRIKLEEILYKTDIMIARYDSVLSK
jgi:hypothetical protein